MNFADLTEETTTANSTATITLLGASNVLMRPMASAFAMGTTDILLRVSDTLGNWEIGLYTLTSATLLTRTGIRKSSNANLAVTFPTGTKKVSCVLDASAIADFAPLSQGLEIGGLAVADALAGTEFMTLLQGGVEKKVLLTTLKTYFGAAAAAATGVTMTGPTGGVVSVASTNFTVGVTPAGGTITGTVIVTPADGAAGGTFTPTSVSLTSASPTATFTYTPSATPGARTISVTNNGALTNPANITYTSTAAAATGVTMTGPTGGAVSVASTNFTIGVTPAGGSITGTVTVTPADGAAGGTFTPVSVGLTSAAPTATFTYTPSATAGARTISVTNNGGLTNPANITYTSTSGTAYTVTGFSGNVLTNPINAAGATVYGTLKQIGVAAQSTNLYWDIAATVGGAVPASAKSGWGTSSTVAPAEITGGAGGQNANAGSSINGMSPMTKPGAFENTNNLWVTNGSGTSSWHFWIKPVDGPAVLVGSVTVNNA